MNSTLWKSVALPPIVAALLFVAFGWAIEVPRGDLGMTLSPSQARPGAIWVVSIVPGSPAARAGIRPGEYVAPVGKDLRSIAMFFAPRPNAHVPIVVNGQRRINLTAQAGSLDYPIAATLARVMFLLIAGLLVLRRPSDPSARSLVIFLACFGFAIALENNAFGSPVVTYLVMYVGGALAFLIGSAAAAHFAATFPSGAGPRLEMTLAAVAASFTTVGVLFLIASFVVPVVRALAYANEAMFVAIIANLALTIAILTIGYLRADSDRQRRLWILLTIGVGLLGPLADLVVAVTIGYRPLVDELTIVTTIFLPIGLAYVILRHRVLDVGFVLNRAIVYATVSVVIVGVFVVVETLLARYVEVMSRATSVAVEVGVALLLGFSIRYIHARVDKIIDTLFFRERYEAEAALRNFGRDAAYITDPDTLLQRSVEQVLRYTRASRAGVWLDDKALAAYRPQDSTFEASTAVDENDPAIVAMRARGIVADLRDLRSALPGELAFPMTVRGQLLGALVCGGKPLGESYAPDERSALEAMAAAVAHAYDALEVERLKGAYERLLEGGAPPGATRGVLGTL